MPKLRRVDDKLLRALAATGPIAQQIVDQIRSRSRGRPAADETDYRRLDLWWKCFRRLNRDLTERQALQKFLRVRGEQVAKTLKLRRQTVGSLRKAITRGVKENKQVKRRRIAQWQIVPTGLGLAVLHGRQWMMVSNPHEAVLLRAGMRQALLEEP
jgi:hypothetical protein